MALAHRRPALKGANATSRQSSSKVSIVRPLAAPFSISAKTVHVLSSASARRGSAIALNPGGGYWGVHARVRAWLPTYIACVR
eukprot:3870665-Pleurochrysis_carterae.AAC.3